MPKVTESIIKDIATSGISSLDILWSNIEIQFAAVIRSQKIMHVKSKKDMTKELKRTKNSQGDSSWSEEKEYEIQFAWDKQERFLNAQSKAMQTLSNMIKTYEELLNKNWDLATEEQKVRIEVLKSRVNVKDINKEDKLDKYFEALESVMKSD